MLRVKQRQLTRILLTWPQRWLLESALNAYHYNDVIMGTIASQITNFTIVYSTVYSDADQRKHQSSASLAFVLGIHRGPVNFPHKWPVTRNIFPFDDVIMYCLLDGCRKAFHGVLSSIIWNRSWALSKRRNSLWRSDRKLPKQYKSIELGNYNLLTNTRVILWTSNRSRGAVIWIKYKLKFNYLYTSTEGKSLSVLSYSAKHK